MKQKAELFANLHQKGNPLVLYNIWDAGSAIALEKAGANAVATGSDSVAAAHGYDDGELIPLDLVEIIAKRISESVSIPFTLDFESGYAQNPDDLYKNMQRVLKTGAVGINFEDQIINGKGRYSIDQQVERIKAMRQACDDAEMSFFINARADMFLKDSNAQNHSNYIAEAKECAVAYAEAGASGFFVPGLSDKDLINEICEASTMPVNIMSSKGISNKELAECGVSRISYGPAPYRTMIEDLESRYTAIS